MSSGSILGLQEDLGLPNKKRISSKPKVSMPDNLITKKQTEIGIPQSFFRGISVFVHIQDQNLCQIVKFAMQQVGANVLQEFSLMADLIISDKQVNLIPPSLGRSRGSALVKSANLPAKMPQLVLVGQIRWVFDIVPKEIQDELIAQQTAQKGHSQDKQSATTTAQASTAFHTAKTSATHSTTTHSTANLTTPSTKQISKRIKQLEIVPNKTMIVADSQSRYRPLIQLVMNVPELHFGDTPKGFTISPFERLPDDFRPAMEKIRFHLLPRPESMFQRGPSNNSYCEICGCSFKNAEEHHQSQEHKYHLTSHIWDDFDDLSNYITENKFFSQQQDDDESNQPIEEINEETKTEYEYE